MGEKWIWIVAAAAVLLFAYVVVRKRPSVDDDDWKAVEHPKATRAVVGKGAQPMYFRLTEAFPDLIVLSEVAFSALLWAKSTGTRNTYNRWRADFVLVDKAFRVVAVVELDDSTHQSQDAKVRDTARDVMLESAGYKVVRYRQVPDAVRLQRDIQPPSPEIRARA